MLLDDDVNAHDKITAADTIDAGQLNQAASFDELDIPSAPPVASSDEANTELLDVLEDLPETVIAPSIASDRNVSNTEFMNLLADLPESMVDDDETIDNVRKGLANIGAVLRLNNNTLRRFSTTGDKYIVQTNLQMGPSVALTLRARRESEPHVITE